MQHDNDNLPIRIFICKPNPQGFLVQEATPGFIQRLEDKAAREFLRFLSNSDPLTMGYETIRNMKWLAKLPVPFQWLYYKGTDLFIDFLAKNMLPASQYQEMEQATQDDPTIKSFSKYREFLTSPVLSDSFWNDRIVTCPNCKGDNQAKHNFDFQSFLLHKQPGQFRVSEEEMQAILTSGLWTCKGCGLQFRVVEEDKPQFRWWPVRVGKATGPGGVYIERLPVYALQSLS